jgi:hypothetical protein
MTEHMTYERSYKPSAGKLFFDEKKRDKYAEKLRRKGWFVETFEEPTKVDEKTIYGCRILPQRPKEE